MAHLFVSLQSKMAELNEKYRLKKDREEENLNVKYYCLKLHLSDWGF